MVSGLAVVLLFCLGWKWMTVVAFPLKKSIHRTTAMWAALRVLFIDLKTSSKAVLSSSEPSLGASCVWPKPLHLRGRPVVADAEPRQVWESCTITGEMKRHLFCICHFIACSSEQTCSVKSSRHQGEHTKSGGIIQQTWKKSLWVHIGYNLMPMMLVRYYILMYKS